MPRIREKLMDCVEKTYMPGFKKHITVERTLNPEWYAQQYALEDASTFGLSPRFFQSAMFRPQRKSPEIQGLYFVGARTHPGNGVPIVLISAELATDGILRDHGISSPISPPSKEPTAVS